MYYAHFTIEKTSITSITYIETFSFILLIRLCMEDIRRKMIDFVCIRRIEWGKKDKVCYTIS